jgi:hypothetical protein
MLALDGARSIDHCQRDEAVLGCGRSLGTRSLPPWPFTGPAPASERAAEARQLEHHIKSYIGVSSKVKVAEPGKVERSRQREQSSLPAPY